MSKNPARLTLNAVRVSMATDGSFRMRVSRHGRGTAAGCMLYAVLGAVAQFERDVFHERTVASLAAAKKRGEKLGRRPALTSAQVREAKRMLAHGESPNQNSAYRRSRSRP